MSPRRVIVAGNVTLAGEAGIRPKPTAIAAIRDLIFITPNLSLFGLYPFFLGLYPFFER